MPPDPADQPTARPSSPSRWAMATSAPPRRWRSSSVARCCRSTARPSWRPRRSGSGGGCGAPTSWSRASRRSRWWERPCARRSTGPPTSPGSTRTATSPRPPAACSPSSGSSGGTWARGWSSYLRATGAPLLTTFYSPAIVADRAGLDRIFCVVTDTDLNRVWAPVQPPRDPHPVPGPDPPRRPPAAVLRRPGGAHHLHRLPAPRTRWWAVRRSPRSRGTWPHGSYGSTPRRSSAAPCRRSWSISWARCRARRRGSRPSSPSRWAAPERRPAWPPPSCPGSGGPSSPGSCASRWWPGSGPRSRRGSARRSTGRAWSRSWGTASTSSPPRPSPSTTPASTRSWPAPTPSGPSPRSWCSTPRWGCR